MNNLYPQGESTELSSEGLISSALWLNHEGFLSGQRDFCHYKGATEIEPNAYGPGCPNSAQHSFTNNRLSEAEGGTKILMMGKSEAPWSRARILIRGGRRHHGHELRGSVASPLVSAGLFYFGCSS